MTDQQFCRSIRLQLKLFATIALALAGWAFSDWINNHQIEPMYREPLTHKQQDMKNKYLSGLETPEILIAKDGTTIYYQSNKKLATTERPAWLSKDGELQLEKWQEWQIASQGVLLNTRILGINLETTTVSDFNIVIGLLATASLVATLCGYAIAHGVMLKKLLWTISSSIVLGYYFLSTPILKVTILVTLIGLVIGLLTWPLWALIDYVTAVDHDNQKAT